MANLTIKPERLKSKCKELFILAGVPEDEAEIITEVLVTTEIWGVRSHGVMRTEHYIRCLLSGGINPITEMKISGEGPAWVTINGNGGLGIVISYKAMQLAMEKARQSGIAIVNVNHSHHFGGADYYSMMCARAGMIGIAMSTTGPIMAVTGSAKSAIGNNPFSYAVPAGKYKAVMLDIAMSSVADGKVQIARDLGIPLPDGCIIDKAGRPSNDPNDYFSGGTLLPFGGHKGYGLAMMVDSLAGVLSGAGILRGEMNAWNKNPDKTGNIGHCFMAIDIHKMYPLDHFELRMEEFIAQIKAAPRVENVDRILIPGELEWEKEDKANTHGVELLESCVESLRKAAEHLGRVLDL